LIVKVAIDLALDRPFDYLVPEEFEKELAVGQLLSVPFGNRKAKGFAVEITNASSSPEIKLKPILSIEDTVPFFSSKLLELAKKIAAYTASPFESVLRSAIPAAVLDENVKDRMLYYVEALDVPEGVKLTAKRLWLYEQIKRLGGGWLNQLSSELGTTPSTLKSMAESKVISISLQQKKRSPIAIGKILPSKPLKLNNEQQRALDEIISCKDKSAVLLHGVTGSGKTEVYLQAIAFELEQGRDAIVMVPEISLTPQTVRRFASRFGSKVAVLHSALSSGERRDEWYRIRSGEAKVVIGPRSAVFAPLGKLGLIIVDEEHETSYKQEETPRYNARDIAVLRGAIENAKVVLGSATPSLETWKNAIEGKYALSTMTQRAGVASLPYVCIADMNEENSRGRIFSPLLVEAIKKRLDLGEQTILFLNRRGFSRSYECKTCSQPVTCPKCSVAYTFHKSDSCLRCHICGGWILPPKKCEFCNGTVFDYRGIGTQRVEEALSKFFPRARVLRMDADSTSRKNSHDDILGMFRRKEADILIGTQMIAKGLDFPNVTLVGVLNADSSLNMPDFRAAERTYQLISQVAGRAGRAEIPGEVVVQTYNPDNPVIRAAASSNFAAYVERELPLRKEFNFPPFCRLSLVLLKSKDGELVERWAEAYSKALQGVKFLDVGDALPALIEKADEWYRWNIVVKAASVSQTVKAWKWLQKALPVPKSVRATLDVDAFSLI
jgi:primosomal protein N' (replication factor Y)